MAKVAKSGTRGAVREGAVRGTATRELKNNPKQGKLSQGKQGDTKSLAVAKEGDKARNKKADLVAKPVRPTKEPAKVSSKELPKQPAIQKALTPPSPELKSDRAAMVEKLAERVLRKQENRPGGGAGASRSPFGRPPRRRGRRPKNVEYTPTQQEEDTYVLESEYERLEHDTGIRLKDGGDDGSMGMDRTDDFEEELNFDP